MNRPLTGIDDADIFLVYARNFAHGHGIVWNVGGEHVEGVSSLPFFLLCAGAYAISSSPERILFAVDVLFAILATLCVFSTLRSVADRLSLSRRTYLLFATAYLLWIGANPLYFAWNVVALMDSGLYSLIVTASFALLARIALSSAPPNHRHTLGMAILIALTVIVRPEGLLCALLEIVAFTWISFISMPTRRAALASIRIPLAAYIVTLAALFLFRLKYFGYPLPNTYYAKVSSSPFHTIGYGIRYFRYFTHLYGIAIYLPLILAIGWIGYALAKRIPHITQQGFIVLAAAFSFAAIVMPILEGGEHFASFRMYQSVWPLFFMSVILPVIIFAGRSRLVHRFVYFFTLALLIGISSRCTWKSFAANNRPELAPQDRSMNIATYFEIGSTGRQDGMRTRELFSESPPPSVGLAAVGGFAYGYDGPVDDLMGLNDVRMAHADSIKIGPKDHQSFNRAVFFQEAPDLLVPWSMPQASSSLSDFALGYSNTHGFGNVIFKNIFNDPLFKITYTPASISSDRHPGIRCIAYVRNTYLQRLAADKEIHLTFLPGQAPANWPAASGK